jgi:hypothetical protein
LELPIPTSSIIAFVLTFCVGYVTLLLAYVNAGRLHVWFSLDVFDKTIQTFIIGGIISLTSFVVLSAPVNLLFYETAESYSVWVNWLYRNSGVIVIFELFLIGITALLIGRYLDRDSENDIEYAS